MTWFGLLILVLLALKWAAQLWLEWLNDRNVRAHSEAVPELLKEVVDPATYAQTVEYTLAKSKLRKFELTYEAVILGLTLFSGILPLLLDFFRAYLGQSWWAMGAFLFFVGIVLSVLDLPFDWFAQFRLEERFGFNTTTQKLWWADRLKGLCLGIVLSSSVMKRLARLAVRTASIPFERTRRALSMLKSESVGRTAIPLGLIVFITWVEWRGRVKRPFCAAMNRLLGIFVALSTALSCGRAAAPPSIPSDDFQNQVRPVLNEYWQGRSDNRQLEVFLICVAGGLGGALGVVSRHLEPRNPLLPVMGRS